MDSVLGATTADPASSRPVYRQIAGHLRTAILDGRLQAGDRLPSENQLVGHYGVAPMTARHALQVLHAEGLTRAEQGRGVFVRQRPQPPSAAQHACGNAGWLGFYL